MILRNQKFYGKLGISYQSELISIKKASLPSEAFSKKTKLINHKP